MLKPEPDSVQGFTLSVGVKEENIIYIYLSEIEYGKALGAEQSPLVERENWDL